GGWGGGHHGGPRSAANPGGGLPFAGIPPELRDGVDRLLAEEPTHPAPDTVFSYGATEPGDVRLSLWRLLGDRWRLAGAAALFVVVVSVVNQAGPELIGIGINDGMLRRNMGVVLLTALVYLGAIAVTAGAQRMQVRLTGRLAAGVMHDLRVKVFAHLQRLGLDFYTDEKAGVIMSRMTSDIENLQQLLQDGLAQLVVQALTMVVIAAVLLTMDTRLALITIALALPALIVASLWFRSASERAYDLVRDGIAAVLADLSEGLHGIRTVTAYNRQDHNVVQHRNVVGDYREANNHTAQLSSLYGPGVAMLGYLDQAALLAIGGDMVVHHTLSLGALIAFFVYLNRFFSPIQLLVQQYTTFQQGHASILKLRTLLAVRPSVPTDPAAAELPPVEGDIAFEGVTFGYDPETPVLHDIDLRVRAGETVAFVGRTGAGKSTIAKLVTRFYDPTQGRVLIDGHDLRSVTIDSLRRQLGVVPQEPFLFAGSLRDNIAYADPSATDSEVWEAVRAVGLSEVVERMPEGLGSVVHERGQSLSSGERQLVALARAFHAHPRVLVLDEATSNLDLASEAKVEAALDVLLEARTAILIAHRLSTAMKADRIMVVADGRIVESGPHEELVARDGLYAEMHATWTSHSQGEPAALIPTPDARPGRAGGPPPRPW
ncbi:MAG: ABC transporter ATP-binding protein, partial [Acidimicrobiales bacterium]